VKYWAFISYSHEDEAVARRLHRRLEAYRLPKGVEPGRTPDGLPARRLAPVFRDRDELAAASELGTVLQDALEQSDALLVVCSPAAARSRWVGLEIEAFRALGRDDRIFPFVVAGEPSAETGTVSACFPPALLRALGPGKSGSTTVPEPLAADARPGRDGFPLAVLKLVAGLVQVPFDGLRNRESARRTRRLVTLTAFLGLIALALAGLTIWALQNESLAQENAAEARKQTGLAEESAGREREAKDAALASEKEARQRYGALLIERGRQLLVDGEREKAIPLLIEASDAQPAAPRLPLLLGLSEAPYRGRRLHLSGHRAKIRSAAWSSDGEHLATASDSGSLLVWSAENGAITRHLHVASHRAPDVIQFVPSRPDLLVLTSDAEPIRIVDWRTGVILHAFRHGAWFAPRTGHLLSPDGRTCVTIGACHAWAAPGQIGRRVADATIDIWDLATGERRHQLAHGDRCHGARMDAQGRLLTWADDRTLRLWDVNSGAQLASVEVDDDVISAAFGDDAETLLLVTKSGGLKAWTEHRGLFAPTDADWSRSARRILTNSRGRMIVWTSRGPGRTAAYLVDAHSYEIVAQVGRGIQQELDQPGISFDSAGLHVVATEYEDELRVFSAGTGRQIGSVRSVEANPFTACMSPNGWEVLSVADSPENAAVWTVQELQPRRQVKGHAYAIIDVRPTLSGRGYLSRALDRTVRIWSEGVAEDRSLLLAHPLPEGKTDVFSAPPPTAEVSRSGREVATAGPDGTARIWDAKDGHELATVKPMEGQLRAASFGPVPGQLVTGSSSGSVDLWAWRDGSHLATLASGGHAIDSVVRFGAQGVAAHDGRQLILWLQADGGQVIKHSEFDRRIRTIQPSPSARWLAVTDSSDSVLLVDSATPGAIRRLGPHPLDVDILAFSDDEKLLATSTGRAQVYLWNVSTGKAAGEWHVPNGRRVKSLAFLPGGAALIVGTGQGMQLLDVVGMQALGTVPGAQVGTSVRSLAVAPGSGRLMAGLENGAVELVEVPLATRPAEAAKRLLGIGGWRLEAGTLRAAAWDVTLPTAVELVEPQQQPASAGAATRSGTPSQEILQARQAISERRFGEAVLHAEAALGEPDLRSAALSVLTQATHEMKQHEKAASYASALLETSQAKEDRKLALMVRAASLEALGQYALALQSARVWLPLMAKDDTDYWAATRAFLERGNPAFARACLERAAPQPPHPARYFVYRGRAAALEKDHEAALADYDRAISMEPDFAQAYFRRGLAQWDVGHPREARADFTKCLDLDPTFAPGWVARGNVRREIDPQDSAMDDFDRAVDLDAGLAIARLKRGAALAKMAAAAIPREQQRVLYERALQDFETYMRLAPRGGDIERVRRAIQSITKVLRMLPGPAPDTDK
jgi:WD40 repeat protein